MTESPFEGGATPLRVAMRFDVASDRASYLTQQLQELVDLLAVLPGCESVDLGRSTDDPTMWVLVSRWHSVGAYRRALSSYDIKLRQPVLAQAVDEPSAFEVLYASEGGVITRTMSARAVNAETVDLGQERRKDAR